MLSHALPRGSLKPNSVKLQLWDIAGQVASCHFVPVDALLTIAFLQDRFHNLTRNYYREAKGAVIVFDQTSTRSFSKVSDWKATLDQNLPGIPIVVMQNKCDQVSIHPDIPTDDAMVQWATTNGKSLLPHSLSISLSNCSPPTLPLFRLYRSSGDVCQRPHAPRHCRRYCSAGSCCYN
jgi:GTPase SAR1 family protein